MMAKHFNKYDIEDKLLYLFDVIDNDKTLNDQIIEFNFVY